METERTKRLRLIAKLCPQKIVWVWDACYAFGSKNSTLNWFKADTTFEDMADHILKNHVDVGYILELSDGAPPTWIPPTVCGLPVYEEP